MTTATEPTEPTGPGGSAAPDAAPSPARPRRRGAGRGEGTLAALLLSPTLVVLALVIGYPLLAALRESFYRQGEGLDANGFVISGDRFAGLDNYLDAFTGANGSAFWNAFWNTTFFTVVTVAVEVVLGLAMALVMHQALRGRGLVRASILVPWAIPTAVSGLLWRWVFDADGVANALLGHQVLWTADGWPAKFAVIIADTWKTAPFIGLLVLAGLQLIPGELYEAARVDGASSWRQLRSITLPLVKPTLLIAVLFRILDVLRMFDLPYVLTGGQKHSVQTLSVLAYNEASNLHYGPAAAYATLLFCYVVIVAYVFVKLLGADLIAEARSPRAPEDRSARLFPRARRADRTAQAGVQG
ncbi:carbohydrate ABC transporter permease [Streptomyces odontomachi]|uniref:carbohydrate ABC transporter permease n=1 Tax=Streptomyces odontomachi TaxID=2944940 RepID=UPI00210C1F1C|nr:sugar ABC transporter permease [Streptomyces sp. ODS25]